MKPLRFCLNLATALAPLATLAADLYVSHLADASGAPFYNGAPSGAYVTNDLQAAVDHAAAGDTIWVEDGFVCESFESEKIDSFDVHSLLVSAGAD